MKEKYIYLYDYEITKKEYTKMAIITHCFNKQGRKILYFVILIVCLFFLDKTDQYEYIAECIICWIFTYLIGFFMSELLAPFKYYFGYYDGVIEFYNNYFLFKTEKKFSKFYYNEILEYKELKKYIYFKNPIEDDYYIIKKSNCSRDMINFLKKKLTEKETIDYDIVKNTEEMKKLLYRDYENESDVLCECNIEYDVDTVRDNIDLLIKGNRIIYIFKSLYISLFASIIIEMIFPNLSSLLVFIIIYIIAKIIVILYDKAKLKNYTEEKINKMRNPELCLIFFKNYFIVLRSHGFSRGLYKIIGKCIEKDSYIFLNSIIGSGYLLLRKSNCNKKTIEFIRDKFK